MGIYDVDGVGIHEPYDVSEERVSNAYDIDGEVIWVSGVDYTSYSWTQQFANKGIAVQGFDIYDNKVFWAAPTGNNRVATLYVLQLSDGEQIAQTTAVTYHGNNLDMSHYPEMYAWSAYSPSRVYISDMNDDYTSALIDTLIINDGSVDCDGCLDPDDNTILWTLGHTAGSSDLSAPYRISKWDLHDMTDNGDGTHTPALLQTVTSSQPASSFFYQGCKMHDGVLWYANGNGSGRAYVYGVDPDTGEQLYTIDLETSTEPEGLAWYPDDNAYGGYALYVGFRLMGLRKYTFAPL